jgi:hypothetical protein
MQIPGVTGYTRPTNPCTTAEIPNAATPVAAKILIQEHGEAMRAYRLANNVNKARCKAILDAFDDKFLAARADPIVRYANETAISFITQIKSNTIYFNCACATLICINQTKQNGSHNTPLRELGRDQFNQLHLLRPIIRIKYRSLLVLVTMLH